MIALVSRPAYKVVLTEAVPSGEVRSAVAINSMTETASLVVVNAAGSMLLGLVGLPVAFVLNTTTYLVAATSPWSLRDLGQPPVSGQGTLTVRRLLSDLRDGLVYLARQPRLLYPLLLTFATIVALSPAIGLLAAIVHAEDGSIVDLGLLATASSLGAFVGAGFAGAHNEGDDPVRRYALLAIIAAVALALFAYLPVGIASLAPLATLGFVAFSKAVWNTSRVRRVADAAYQARIQAITSMAFTLGFSVGMLWAGVAIDRLGLVALVGGAVALTLFSVAVAFATRRLAKLTK
jgi:predicted MFS family arabinose efflux permease